MPAALLALFLAAPAAAGDYASLAAELAAAARKAGARRVAVLTLETIAGMDPGGAAAVSERLVGELARQDGLQVVERTLLGKVMEEQRLTHSGAVDPRGAAGLGQLMGVEAIISGSLIRKSSRKVEVNLRLIAADDARVLGSARAEIRPDWQESAGFDTGMPVPPPPSLDGDFTPWWERGRAAAAASCDGWEGRVDGLQSAALSLKVRFWAAELDAGVDRRALKRNPGSEIRSLETRAVFYARLRSAMREGGAAPLSAAELGALSSAEASADSLTESCGR
ncbi:MAG: hypothetical protein HYZ75_11735 [Elusimicrobia bacterium]|nr:hypothetical protein [Elusimicrobiota bacterium]